MDTTRVRLFSARFRAQPLPQIKTVDQAKLKKIQEDLAAKAGTHQNTLSRIIGYLWQSFERVPGFQAREEKFNLSSALASCGISPHDNVYVYWDDKDELESFRMEELSDKFKGIWFANMDNIVLFDDSFLWILYVNSNGDLMKKKFS